MPLYLVDGYRGTGTRANPYRPTDAPGWSAVKLTPGGPRALALLWTPASHSPDTRLTKLADDRDERLAPVSRRSLETKLGAVTDTRATTVRSLVASLLLAPPGRKWPALRPTHDGRLPIWLGGVDWGMRSIAGGATATSAFAGSENPLSESSVWVTGDGDWVALKKVSGVVRAVSVGAGAARLVTPTIGGNQYCQVTVRTSGSTDGHYAGPLTRMATGADESAYLGFAQLHTSEPKARIHEVNASLAFTELALVDPNSWADTDVAKLSADGSALTFQQNGTTILTATDTTLVSGQPGFYVEYEVAEADAGADNFEASDLDSGYVVVMRRRRR